MDAGFFATQTLRLDLTGLATLPGHAYAAASLRESHVSGYYRYTAREARFTHGAVLGGHYNVSVYAQLPAESAFTYSNIEQRAAGVSLSLQH